MKHRVTKKMTESGPAAPAFRCVSPVDGRVYAERPLASEIEVENVLRSAREAARSWRTTTLEERMSVCRRFVDAFVARRDVIAEEISWQIGRPIRHAPSEVRGVEERARAMIDLAPEALVDIRPKSVTGLTHFIRREPVGVVFVMTPWNYPYLTAVNAVVPALLAGNAVVLKHSEQTFLCAERFKQAFDEAGLPPGLFGVLRLSHAQCARLIERQGGPDFISFTGSVGGGSAVQRSAAQRSERFVGVGLELGGKDGAYVRADADLDGSAAALADGAFYNAGQSCCAVERVYVHADVYDRFVDRFVAAAYELRLGDPLDPETTLGPLVRTSSADFVRKQIRDAQRRGARALVDAGDFAAEAPGTPYLAPQVLVEVNHAMRIMTEETFGPVVGIMKVKSDREAVRLINDSAYGLTASIWTSDEEAATQLGARLQVGTVFMNRCDYLDPLLAWTGVKSSGRGVSLSRLGYEQLTQPKSYHLHHSAS